MVIYLICPTCAAFFLWDAFQVRWIPFEWDGYLFSGMDTFKVRWIPFEWGGYLFSVMDTFLVGGYHFSGWIPLK